MYVIILKNALYIHNEWRSPNKLLIESNSNCNHKTPCFCISSCVLGFFARVFFQKMPALEGQFLKEVSVRFAGENHLRTQKNTKQSSAQRFLNDPFPKTPFFSC